MSPGLRGEFLRFLAECCALREDPGRAPSVAFSFSIHSTRGECLQQGQLWFKHDSDPLQRAKWTLLCRQSTMVNLYKVLHNLPRRLVCCLLHGRAPDWRLICPTKTLLIVISNLLLKLYQSKLYMFLLEEFQEHNFMEMQLLRWSCLQRSIETFLQRLLLRLMLLLLRFAFTVCFPFVKGQQITKTKYCA